MISALTESPSHELCGLDEAGRGPLAGPITAAAVILRVSVESIIHSSGVPLKDGKLLSPRQREKIYDAIISTSSLVCITSIGVSLINRKGIGWANKELFCRLIRRIEAASYIIDGNLRISVPGKNDRIHSVIDADATIPETILAGIVAKTHRDRIMSRISKQYPMYDWVHNAGYGTSAHIEAIRTYGSSPYHRETFVRTALKGKAR